MYSSNSTVALLAESAAEAAADSVTAGPLEHESAQASSVQKSGHAQVGLNAFECPACSSVEGLPLQQWAAEQRAVGRTTMHLPWGQDVHFDEVDYVGSAEVVCNCLAGAAAPLNPMCWHACIAG